MGSIKSNNDLGGFQANNLDDGLLSHQVADHVRTFIRNGELKTGDRLPSERELSEEFGVSRTIVREAINLLKASGIIRSKPGVGSFVTAPSVNILEVPLSYLIQTDAQKIKELQQAREVFEPAIVTLAAQAALPEDLVAIQASIDEMRENLNDRLRYMQSDQSFHLALVQASHNIIFTLCMNSIIDLLKEGMWLAVHTPGAIERSLDYHEKILAAIQAKDSQLARHTMQDHLHQATMDIMAIIQS